MKDRTQQRIIALQRQLKVARLALLKIREYARNPDSIAGEALYEIENIEAASNAKRS